MAIATTGPAPGTPGLASPNGAAAPGLRLLHQPRVQQGLVTSIPVHKSDFDDRVW